MAVRWVTICADKAGQRIDNFLMATYNGVPKSRLYRALRSGEVRVNKKRIKPIYRIQADDIVRLPPLKEATKASAPAPGSRLRELLAKRIVIETDDIIVLNKPSGLPVHGGTAQSQDVMNTLRAIYPNQRFLELIHRLDKPTSGCLFIAKNRRTLLAVQAKLRERRGVRKSYLMLVKGCWPKSQQTVTLPLIKNHLQSGERMVTVSHDGKEAITHFQVLKHYSGATLLKARLITGRTHQLRVHTSHLGFPIVGDEKYGDSEFNKIIKRRGLPGLLLHAAEVSVSLEGGDIAICTRPEWLDDVQSLG